MQNVKSLAKAVSKEMAESLKGTEELLTLALTKAQKDNNTVYLERVPPFAGVCVCLCVCLWRGVSVCVDLEVALCVRGGWGWKEKTAFSAQQGGQAGFQRSREGRRARSSTR